MRIAFVSVLVFCAPAMGCEWWRGASDEAAECRSVSSPDDFVLGGQCFRVKGDLTIGGGQTVVLGEGSEVRFDDGASLRVEAGGQFVSSGYGGKPVRLGPGSGSGSGDGCWGGVFFGAGSSGSMQGTIVSGAGFPGKSCSCGGDDPQACVTISPGAQVTLQQVGVADCAGGGVVGQPTAAGQVGCGALGMCDSTAKEDCILGGGGDPNAWCPDGDSTCWDDDQDGGEEECGVADRRCADDRLVQACVGGKWATVSDCGVLTNGQTACRSYDGFPRCGLPGPAECLALPEQVGRSYVPGCDEEGCPEYRAACKGAGQPKSPLDDFAVAGCLHPNILAGPSAFTGLGPQWMRLILYNWGGLPDTTQGTVRFTLNGGDKYDLRVWLPPRAKYEREFWGQRGTSTLTNLAMPPPGEQYEVLVEVTSALERPSGQQVKALTLVQTTERWWDEEVVLWRQYGGGDYHYARCNLVEEAKEWFGQYEDDVEDFFTDVCVNTQGVFVDRSGAEVSGLPNFGEYPPHADPDLVDCDTWDLVIEYVDQVEEP